MMSSAIMLVVLIYPIKVQIHVVLEKVLSTFLTLLMLLVMSWNVLVLCTLNLKALFMV